MAITLRKNNSKKESNNSKKESNNSKKESSNSKKESSKIKKESSNSEKKSSNIKKESSNRKTTEDLTINKKGIDDLKTFGKKIKVSQTTEYNEPMSLSNNKNKKLQTSSSLTTPDKEAKTKNTFKKDEIELASGILTIDGVVRLLLLNMVGVEHFEKERSKIDNNNISKFYLRSLTSELVIYDELDLVLISYGCMISIKLEGDGELFSSALPDEYSHRVYIRIGKGQLSSDTVSPSLKYKPGSFKKVEKYLSTRNIPKAVSFPNKIRELISDDANENLRNMEYFEDYTGEISTVFDIDGICGVIPTHVPNPFKTNLFLCVNIKDDPRPVSKSFVHNGRQVKEFPSVKLGMVNTYLGMISLFVLFPYEYYFDLALFIKQVGTLVDRRVGREKKLFEKVINRDEIGVFVARLKELYPDLSLFVESYGSKAGLASHSSSLVLKGLSTIFISEVIPYLTYDVAITAIPLDETAIFLNPDSFRRLHLKGNYRLGICSKMQNHNEIKCKKVGDAFKHSYGCVTKVNLYSLLEDMVVRLRKTTYLPEMSLRLAQESFEGMSFSRGRRPSFESQIGAIHENMDGINRLGYRLEMSTRGSEVLSVVNVLMALAQPRNFIAMDYCKFKHRYLNNLLYLNALFRGDSFDDLINNISVEMTLKEIYVKGSGNKHCLPKSYNIEAFYGSGMPLIDDRLKEAIGIGRGAGITMVKTLLKGNQLKFVKPEFLNLLKRYVSMITHTSLIYKFNEMFSQYNEDFSKYYNEKNIILNYRELGNAEKHLKDNEVPLSLNFYLEEHFLGSKVKVGKLPYLYLMDEILKDQKITLEVAKKHLYTIFKVQGINIGWIYNTKPFENKAKMVLLVYDVGYLGNQTLEIMQSKTLNVYNRYLNEKGFVSLMEARPSWTNDDLIRCANGVMRYSGTSSELLSTYLDVLYGFYLGRTCTNAIYCAEKGGM